jgi:hypothetical protein
MLDSNTVEDGFPMAVITTLGDAYQAKRGLHMRCLRGFHRGIVKIDPWQFEADLSLETLACTRGSALPVFVPPSPTGGEHECPLQIALRDTPEMGVADVRISVLQSRKGRPAGAVAL